MTKGNGGAQAGKGGSPGGKGGGKFGKDLYKGQRHDNPVGGGYQGVCWNCGRVGHKQSECRFLGKQDGKWRVNEVEDEGEDEEIDQGEKEANAVEGKDKIFFKL